VRHKAKSNVIGKHITVQDGLHSFQIYVHRLELSKLFVVQLFRHLCYFEANFLIFLPLKLKTNKFYDLPLSLIVSDVVLAFVPEHTKKK
jgi:hypothetical protein